MKKILPLFAFSAFVLFPAGSVNAQTGTTGKFQIFSAIPDPVNAGERVVFRTTILNQGTEAWGERTYFIEAEIYDGSKDFAGKSERTIGGTDVNPGETAQSEINFIVPPKYSGTYYYRILLVQNGRRIAESDLQEFNVTGIQGKTALWKPQWLKFSGQMTLSFRNTDSNNWRNFVGNASFNGTTGILKGKTELSFDSFLTSKSTASETWLQNVENRVQNLLLKNAGNNYVFAVGDIIPSFSYLSLSGAGMRGAYLKVNSGKLSNEVVLTRLSEPQTPSDGFPGVYERWVWGVRTKYGISGPLNIGASYVAGEDKANSLMVSTSAAAPQRGGVYGFTLDYKPYAAWTASYELMFSEINPDIFAQTESRISGLAYRAEISRTTAKSAAGVWYINARPNFCAIGSPGIQGDRRILDFHAGASLTDDLSVGAGFNTWSDNLLNDASKLTTTQNTYRANAGYAFGKPLPSVSLSYSFNNAAANDISKQDNNTSDIGIVLGRQGDKTSKTFWSAQFQQVSYTDKTGLADNLLTRKTALNVRTPAGTAVTIDSGLGLTKIDNISRSFSGVIQSYVASVFWNTLPGRFSMQFWVNHSIEGNDAPEAVMKKDFFKTDTVTEFSFTLKPGLTVVIGGILNVKTDRITDANSSTERGVTTRLILNF